MSELIVDNFAGGGGASSGIEAALGRPIDYAINHDPLAIAMHRANHPATKHFTTSVWDVDPRALAAGREVGLGWFSPDCTFHSKARGGKPFRDRDIARRRRGLAWLVPAWMRAVRPRVVMLENVEEFAQWGPLDGDGRPCPIRKGMTFRRWVKQIQNLGYELDMRELRACDYGAPTTRKRLFVIARCDGEEIVFPEPTHGRGLEPYRAAAECIDWSLPCQSIFERSKPLADNTLRRIARGVMRYVVNNPQPFIVPGNGDLLAPTVVRIGQTGGGGSYTYDARDPLTTITTKAEHLLVVPHIMTMRNSGKPFTGVDEPTHTITASGAHQMLVAAFIAKHYGDKGQRPGLEMVEPLATITTQDHHAVVQAFLLKFYGTDQDPRLERPLDTVTTKHRFGLVTVHGEQYRIVDIRMRMLAPRELYRAQSFSDSYIIEHGIDEAGAVLPLTKTSQIQMCGNSVPPALSEALVRSNYVPALERSAAA